MGGDISIKQLNDQVTCFDDLFVENAGSSWHDDAAKTVKWKLLVMQLEDEMMDNNYSVDDTAAWSAAVDFATN